MDPLDGNRGLPPTQALISELASLLQQLHATEQAQDELE
jgi:hypothetical protein